MAAKKTIAEEWKSWVSKGGSANNVAISPSAASTASSSAGGGGSSSGERGQSPLEWGFDMISRPLYAVTGGLTRAIRDLGKSSAGDAIGSVLEGAWKGLTSTDAADKKHGVDVIDEAGKRFASDIGKVYEAPTLANTPGISRQPTQAAPNALADPSSGVRLIGGKLVDMGDVSGLKLSDSSSQSAHKAAATARGLGGFGIDVAADPLTYGTLGIGTGIKLAGKGVAAGLSKVPAVGRAAQTAREVGEKAASAVRGAAKESDVAPAPSAVDEGISPVAAPASRNGAINVAGPAPTGLTSPKSSSVSVPRVKNPKATPASLPKVSETINSSSKNVVAAILNANRQLDEAAAKGLAAAPTPKPAPKSAKGTEGTLDMVEPVRVALEGVKKPLLQNVKLPGAGRAVDLYPTTIINELGKRNLQGQREFINYVVRQAKERGAITPELQRTVAAAKSALEGASAAPQAVGNAARVAGDVPAKSPTKAVTDELVESGARSQLLPALLREGRKVTPLGKEIKATLGEQLFRKLSSSRTNPAERDQIFEELSTLAKDADSVSPTTFDGMHENVRHLVEDRMNLRREDFDLEVRQKMLERDIAAQTPRLTNPKTARAVNPEKMRAATAMTGHSAKVLLNDSIAQTKKIVGEAFDPSKGKFVGNTYFYDDGVRRLAIINGRIDKHSMMDAVNGARNEIDKALPSTKGMSTASAMVKTRARRYGTALEDGTKVPSIAERVGVWEKEFIDSGVPVGLHIGDEFVMLHPSAVYGAADDIIREARQAGDPSLAKVLDDRANIVLYNPGTAAPETLLWEAHAQYLLGASDDALRAILRTTKSKYNGTPIGRNPLARDGAGLRYRNTKFTAEQLTELTLDYIKRTSPAVQARSLGVVREYAKKSTTDAGAMASILGDDLAGALARGDGPAMDMLSRIESDLARLSQEYGASAHATGMAADALSRNLPTWAVKRAKSVASNEAAYINAARMGKSADEIRAMGAASEVRHTPVEVRAAADDMEQMEEFAKDLNRESELYGLGTDTRSVLYNEVRYRSLWDQMTHPLRKRFDARYGAVVDGVDFTKQTRIAAGSPAQDILEMSRYISQWGKKYNSVRLGKSDETVASAAFKLLQRGADDAAAVEPMVLQALEELKPIAARMFDIDNVGFNGDLFFGTGSQNIRYLERSMEVTGMGRKYGDVFSERIAKGDGSVTSWWREIDVDDPVEFLNLYNASVHAAIGERTSMLLLVDELKRTGLLSMKAKPGFAKPKLEGNSFFYAGLEDSGAFIDKRVLEAMSEVDRAMYAARGFGANSPITNIIDPALSAWKVAMTIYRPGHHIRNIMSNGMLAYIAEGPRNLAKSGVVAAQIIYRRSGKDVAAMGEMERLLKGKGSKLKNGGDQVVQTTKLKNGKTLKLTDGMFNDAFARRGGWRTFRQSEDIIEGQGIVQRASDAAIWRGRLPEKIAGGLSEGIDHHGYLQQFIQVVLNNAQHVGTKFKSLDDLYDFAIQRSYKFHPDSAVLAPFESKYMRRIAPFYTWFRGTLPGVIESAMMHPGRVMIANKASFNIAQTMGIDAESFANPWPEDADVPDFMRESAYGANAMFGDQMYLLDPGFAHQSLASDFFGRGPEEGGNFITATLSGAARAMWDMATPFIKAPIELAAGEKLFTGSAEKDNTQIRQAGDYIDDQIPLLNYLSKSSGVSFTGTLMNPGAALEQGRPIERSEVQRGYQESIFGGDGLFGLNIGEKQHRTFLNFALGQNAQPVDTKTQKAQKDAEAKARKAEREEQGLYQGGVGKSSYSSSGGGSSSSSEPAPTLSFEGVSPNTPARAELNSSTPTALQQFLEESSGKKLTASQLLSAIKAQQAEELAQQSSLYGMKYRQQLISQLQAANPELSMSELIQLAKQYPYPYE